MLFPRSSGATLHALIVKKAPSTKPVRKPQTTLKSLFLNEKFTYRWTPYSSEVEITESLNRIYLTVEVDSEPRVHVTSFVNER